MGDDYKPNREEVTKWVKARDGELEGAAKFAKGFEFSAEYVRKMEERANSLRKPLPLVPDVKPTSPEKPDPILEAAKKFDYAYLQATMVNDKQISLEQKKKAFFAALDTKNPDPQTQKNRERTAKVLLNQFDEKTLLELHREVSSKGRVEPAIQDYFEKKISAFSEGKQDSISFGSRTSSFSSMSSSSSSSKFQNLADALSAAQTTFTNGAVGKLRGKIGTTRSSSISR